MSRFIDELTRMAKANPQPIGFRATRSVSSEPRILLIASLSQDGDTGRLDDCVDGADAALLRFTKSDLAAKSLQKIVGSLPDIPWGGWLEDIGARKIETLVEAGCDFVVFSADSRVLTAPQESKVGKILQVESSLGDGLLRAINDLPVDAVLASDAYGADGAIAWHHLLLFQRLANYLTKPLLVPVPLNVTAGELKTLWEAGVDGVTVEVGNEAGRLRELRRSVGEIKFPPTRKRGKTEARLPRISGETGSVTPDEEEEEEE